MGAPFCYRVSAFPENGRRERKERKERKEEKKKKKEKERENKKTPREYRRRRARGNRETKLRLATTNIITPAIRWRIAAEKSRR